MSRRHARLVAIGAALVFAPPLSAQGGAPTAASAARAMTVGDYMRLRSVIDASLSPDGRRVAWVLADVDSAADRPRRTIWVAEVDSAAPRRVGFGTGDAVPRWSPDGRTIGFLSARGGAVQVWLRDLRTRAAQDTARAVTSAPFGVNDFAWSPDGRSIAYIAGDSLAPPPVPGVRRAGAPGRLDQLHVLDLDSGSSRRLTRASFTVDELAWSPDGREIVITHSPSSTVHDGILNSDLSVVTVATGAVRALVSRPGMDVAPRWSPDGRSIAFVSHDGRARWIGDTYLCVVAAAGGTARNLTSALGERILQGELALEWRTDSRALYYAVPSGMGSRLLEIDLRGRARPIGLAERATHAFTFSTDGRRMAFLATRPDMPWELFVGTVGDSVARRVTESNPELAGFALGGVREVHWRSRDGTRVEGLLVLPVGYDASRRYPTIAYLHGGPAWNMVAGFAPHGGLPKSMQGEMYPLHVLAAHGYAIFLPNFRGSLGYGSRYRLANVSDWGGKDADDVMTGLDSLVAAGIADEHRLGVMGSSYGGTLGGLLLARTRRFRAAQIHAGIVDPVSMFGETDIPEFVREYFGGPPWERTAAYAAGSALSRVARMNTPVLIVHGEADRRVPVSQGRALYRALHDRGVPVELVTYADQAHGFARPSLQRDMMTRLVEWFDRWLLAAGAAAVDDRPR